MVGGLLQPLTSHTAGRSALARSSLFAPQLLVDCPPLLGFLKPTLLEQILPVVIGCLCCDLCQRHRDEADLVTYLFVDGLAGSLGSIHRVVSLIRVSLVLFYSTARCTVCQGVYTLISGLIYQKVIVKVTITLDIPYTITYTDSSTCHTGMRHYARRKEPGMTSKSLGVREASRLSGIHTDHIIRWRRSGCFPDGITLQRLEELRDTLRIKNIPSLAAAGNILGMTRQRVKQLQDDQVLPIPLTPEAVEAYRLERLEKGLVHGE